MKEKWEHLDQLLSATNELLSLPDNNDHGFEEKYESIVQFLECIVSCSQKERERYTTIVEKFDRDIVDLEHLYVFKKAEESGGRPMDDSVRNMPEKWANLGSEEIASTLMDTLVERRRAKDSLTIYEILSSKIGLSKTTLSNMATRIYTVGKIKKEDVKPSFQPRMQTTTTIRNN